MIHSKRKPVSKFHSVKKFRHDSGKTHRKNMQMRPMRGGYRL